MTKKTGTDGKAKSSAATKLLIAKQCVMRRLQMDAEAVLNGDTTTGRCEGDGCENELMPYLDCMKEWKQFLPTLTKPQALQVLEARAEAPKHNLPAPRPNVQLHLIDNNIEEPAYTITELQSGDKLVLCNQCKSNIRPCVEEVMDLGATGNWSFVPMKHQFDTVNSKYGDAVRYLDPQAQQTLSAMLARVMPAVADGTESIEFEQQHDGDWLALTEDMDMYDDYDDTEVTISDHDMSVLPVLFKVPLNNNIKLVVKHLQAAWYPLGGPRPIEDVQAEEARRARLSQQSIHPRSTVSTTVSDTSNSSTTDLAQLTGAGKQVVAVVMVVVVVAAELAHQEVLVTLRRLAQLVTLIRALSHYQLN
jgi:hypothetical protein